MNYGTKVDKSTYRTSSEYVAEPERTGSGNVVLRVYTDSKDPEAWIGGAGDRTNKLAHVVLTPDEATGLAEQILALVPQCLGHPASVNDPMGKSVYCDGTCRTDGDS